MKKSILFIFTLTLSIMFVSCKQNSGKNTDAGETEATNIDSNIMIKPKYATGFKVKYLNNGIRLVDVIGHDMSEGMEMGTMMGMKGKGMKHHKMHSEDESKPTDYHFALVQHGSKVNIPDGYTRVEVPITKTICMTSLQLSNFTILNAHNIIKGITGTKNLYDKDILQRVKDGRIVKIGTEGNFDAELIMAANPDVIFISPFKRGGYETIKETGITLVPHLGYKELNPLGQAEWIKFVAMFIGKEKEANKIFKGIEQRYNDIKALTAKVKNRPVVFSGEMHGGNWFAVGGRNYLAQIFRDAGAEYVLKNDKHTGGIPMDFEHLYASAANTGYWRILNSFPGHFSYDALKASDPRNANFKAFKDKHVIYCNMRETPYYEISPVEPDVLLKDFVAIFHPELIPKNYKPTFYILLK